MDAKIIVATHKPYRMPGDPMYLPVHAGRLGKDDIGYIGDDTGDNISERNWYYSEVSAIYWAWKNLDADVLGVAHYRRHFTKMGGPARLGKDKWDCVLTSGQLEELLDGCDILVANKRPYVIETNRSHYGNAHNPKELDLLQQIMRERCPEYLDAFEEMLSRRWAHMFNMFIMRRDKYDEFCEWWFDLLFEFEQRVDMTGYIDKERRAYIDEIMLDMWLVGTGYPYREVPVMYMESQNWLKKGGSFLKRKYVTHRNE